MSVRSDRSLITVVVGAFIAFLILLVVVACNTDDGGSTYYPHDSSHGYYDTHHHYHYYPKYNPGSKSYVKPAPRANKGFSGNKSGGYKSGGSRRR